jgi:Secretion system C-terminal sorting domain
MKTKILILFLMALSAGKAQSLIQSVNSGSIVASNSSISIGEIVVVPINQNQSNSGIIGILSQVNNQNLEVSQFEITKNILVYPNPTSAEIYFKTNENLANQSVLIIDQSGKIVLNTFINADKTMDLKSLSAGIYLIQFSNNNYKSFKIIKK